jgi:alanine racemase
MSDLDVVRPLWAEIDLDALEGNYREVVRLVGPDVKVIPSVKANAYGHGVVEIARVLSAQGIYALACGSLPEAIAVRQAGVAVEILLFVSYVPETVPQVLTHGFVPTVANMETARAVSAAARRPAAIYVKVDSGLGRLGVPIWEAVEFVKQVATLPRIIIEGIYTHLPFGDPAGRAWAETRHREFREVLRTLAQVGISVPITQAVSSAGILAKAEHGCSAVCPGHVLYGLPPVSPAVADCTPFRPVLRAIRTRLIHVTKNAAARAVGLGGHYPVAGGTVTGVVAIGMRDGYRDARTGKATMLLRGHRAPVLGVSLEHTTLDLTGIPEPRVGEEIMVLGRDGADQITLSEMAEWQQAHPLEILTAFSSRVPYRYLAPRPGRRAVVA